MLVCFNTLKYIQKSLPSQAEIVNILCLDKEQPVGLSPSTVNALEFGWVTKNAGGFFFFFFFFLFIVIAQILVSLVGFK